MKGQLVAANAEWLSGREDEADERLEKAIQGTENVQYVTGSPEAIAIADAYLLRAKIASYKIRYEKVPASFDEYIELNDRYTEFVRSTASHCKRAAHLAPSTSQCVFTIQAAAFEKQADANMFTAEATQGSNKFIATKARSVARGSYSISQQLYKQARRSLHYGSCDDAALTGMYRVAAKLAAFGAKQ